MIWQSCKMLEISQNLFASIFNQKIDTIERKTDGNACNFVVERNGLF